MTRAGVIAAMAGAAALVTGCGQSDSTSTAANGPARTVERVTRVEVVKPVGGTRFDPARIYARDAPGVVTVTATGLGGGPGEGALGSGFVLSGDGEIATNAHVVTSGEGSHIRKASAVYVEFADGNNVSARIVGVDPFADVALLKINPQGLTLRPLPLGSTKHAVVGAPVAAIGSPFGEEQSLSVGVISAIGRPIESLTDFDTTGAIQTDAAINHGNSGGPLIDSVGRVLGINSQIRSDSGQGAGVGFAVPIDTVKRSLAQIRREGSAHYAYLGMLTTNIYPQAARRFGLTVARGAWIQEVTPGGPAAKAGLRGGGKRQRFQARLFQTGGDVLVSVGGHRIRRSTDVAQALLNFRPGQTITIVIYRDGKRRAVPIKLGERPLATQQRG
jgi:S1-C subfamily serine protease